MISGLGVDIIEIERVRRAVAKKHFRDNVFTQNEQAYCESRNRSAASYAARFAAKEAFFKATGTGIVTHLTEVEVVNDARGAPTLNFHGKAEALARGRKVHLSISHSKEFATAVCILE